MAASMFGVVRCKFVKSAFKLGYNVLSQSSKLGYSSQCRQINILTGKRFEKITRNVVAANPFSGIRHCSTQQVNEEKEEYHSIIKDVERAKGKTDKLEFQAETRKLLDIVARSLYSEKEVFIRELVSNSSDALEKLRYLQIQNNSPSSVQDLPLEIHIAVDDDKKTFTIQDTGLGMTKSEVIDNLGIIARSGSKAFMKEVESNGSSADKNIIGQFGVGFYSSFMVADKVEVFTQSYKDGEPAYKWLSDGMGSYELCEAENVKRGTKVVLHLRGDCYDFAKEDIVKGIVKKYSNFVGVPIFLNGQRVNVVQALWMMEQKEITPQMHEDFFRFISNSFDHPRFNLHYKTDAPLNIRALFYVPEYKPTLFDMSRDTDMGISLYSRKVLIMAKANNVLPRWLRFVKGVVDSEDIPLNLSRELLQDGSLIKKLRWVLTNRLIKFFLEQSRVDKEKYLDFYKDYGLFIREGVVSTTEQSQREEISRLLRFESSKLPAGELTNFDEYVSRMKAGSRNIYYISAPSRQLAETSPYMEALSKKDAEVLFCYENYDELVLMNLGQFDKKHLRSVENETSEDVDASEGKVEGEGSQVEGILTSEQCEELSPWIEGVLGHRVSKVKATKRLASHPCIITVNEMGAARHFLRTALADRPEEEKFKVLQSTLEVNPSHPLIVSLHRLKTEDPELAKLLAEQLFDNAMVAAGLLDDPRKMLTRLNELMTRAFKKN